MNAKVNWAIVSVLGWNMKGTNAFWTVKYMGMELNIMVGTLPKRFPSQKKIIISSFFQKKKMFTEIICIANKY